MPKQQQDRGPRKSLIKRLPGWPVIAALVATLLSVATFACGSGSDSTDVTVGNANTEQLAPNIVTDADIEQAPADSPERALLSWFQAVQFQDSQQVIDLTTKSEVKAVGEKELLDAVYAVGQSLGRPDISQVEKDGNQATIRLFTLGFTPNDPNPKTATPLTMTLKEKGSEWQVDDARVVIDAADALKQAQKG